MFQNNVFAHMFTIKQLFDNSAAFLCVRNLVSSLMMFTTEANMTILINAKIADRHGWCPITTFNPVSLDGNIWVWGYWIQGWKGSDSGPAVAKPLVILITTITWKAMYTKELYGSRRKRWGKKTHVMWPATAGCSWQGVSRMRPWERRVQVINPNERGREEHAGAVFYSLKESTNIFMG